MDQAELEHLRQRFDREVRERFQGAPIARVEVLQHGDDPGVEPGELLARVVLTLPEGEEESRQAFHAFHEAHREAFHELRRELDKLPVGITLQFTGDRGESEGETRGPTPVIQLRGRAGFADAPGFTPVMARLAQDDLETLDTLIGAGIASSRAEAVRWALARIRERPAYAQLLARTREIEELKAQF